MHWDSIHSDEPTDDRTALPADVLSIVRCWRRRVVLTYLRTNGTASVSELVDHLTRERANAERRGPTDDDETRSRIQLHHVDIPLLADVGLVTYDPVSRTITPASVVEGLDRAFFVTD